jgi:nitrite reductase/ring-hydroxylating ferredoxin subunit
MKPYKRNIFQRLLGICATKPPRDKDCWSYAEDRITLDLTRAPELEQPGSGLRLEGGNCPERVLVIYGDDCRFHAFRNRCEHFGRRLDPKPGEEKIQCCSVNKSTYDYEGKIISGPADAPVKTYPVELEEGTLSITID